MLAGITYYKRNSIKTKITKFFTPTNIEVLITAMNKEPFEPIFGMYEKAETDKVIKIAFVGNSITLHEIAEDIGWTHISGMAASTLENDYVHRTIKKIAETKNTSVKYAILNLSDFERNFTSFDFNRLSILEDFSPNYIVFQLGENVSSEDIKNNYTVFIEKYTQLVSTFSNSATIVCLPFWQNNKKNSAMTTIALKSHSFLVDLSHLDLDERNYARAETPYKHTGVGIHPGDYGMENISDAIFSVFNALIE